MLITVCNVQQAKSKYRSQLLVCWLVVCNVQQAKTKYRSQLFAFWLVVCNVQQAKTKYRGQLLDDPIVEAHLSSLNDNLLEQNLCRIIEPYSRVQIKHVATLVNQPLVSYLLTNLVNQRLWWVIY